jgi:hypothetical protein
MHVNLDSDKNICSFKFYGKSKSYGKVSLWKASNDLFKDDQSYIMTNVN